jgi:glutathione peroxidase
MNQPTTLTSAFYSIEVARMDGSVTTLAEYAGKVLLVVNTASHCAFAPQLKDLQLLQQKYEARGFTVLAFPSGDYLKQEFDNNEAIENFCHINYKTTFPLFAPLHVRGKERHKLFEYLTTKRLNHHANIPMFWNFQKFLFNRQGQMVDHWMSYTSPSSPSIIRQIEKAL